jgi:hypothetical protein
MLKGLSYYLLISVLSSALTVLAQTITPLPEPSAEYKKRHSPREDGDLQLSISTGQSTYVRGKNLVIAIDLKNVSTEPFWFRSFVEHDEGQLNGFVLRVTNNSGQELPLLPQPSPGFRSHTAFALLPGQALHDQLVVNRLVNISSAGQYNMQVSWKYHKSERKITSNVIAVTVPPL